MPLLGSRVVSAGPRKLDAARPDALADRQAEAIALFSIALLQAFRGSFDAARGWYGDGLALLEELGGAGVLAKSSSLVGARIQQSDAR